MRWNRVITSAGLLLCLLAGILLGTGGYTFYYANGLSYMSDDPKVCINCHIMQDEYNGWQKASHHSVASCNDCHLPHDNLLHKFLVKGSNGYHHSTAFTLQNFHEPVRIKPANAKVLEANCLRCHGPMVEEITAHGTLGVPTDPDQQADLYGCVRCHQSVGHGPTR